MQRVCNRAESSCLRHAVKQWALPVHTIRALVLCNVCATEWRVAVGDPPSLDLVSSTPPSIFTTVRLQGT